MAGIEIKEVRVFTRENPCTKVDIWNCFYHGPILGFVAVPIVTARGHIGANAPKYLVRQDFAHTYMERGIDYYRLTESGQNWLSAGLRKMIDKDSSIVDKLTHPMPAPKPRRRHRS